MTHSLYASLVAASQASTRLRRHVLLALVLLIDVVHPLVHGTPLDGGAIDALLPTLNNQIATDTDD